MLQAKKIRALLNGGAAAAGVDGLRAAVDAIAAEIAVHKREIVEIPKLRGEAALADDGEARCAALTARETELCAAIEVAEIRIARLREKLAEQINIRRRDRIEHHRLTAREKFEALASALRAAVEANEAATSAFSEACFELGVADATSLISRGDYLPPGAVVRAMVDHWQRVIRHELDVASQTAPRSPTKQTPVSTVATVATISHGDPGRGPVFLRQILSPGGKLAPKEPVPRPAAKPVATINEPARKRNRPLPPPLSEKPAPGFVRCVVKISDFPHPDTSQGLLEGDVIDISSEKARLPMGRGALAPWK